MISIDVTTTGAAGAAPMPAFVLRPSLADGLVVIAPTSAPQQGTGLPTTGSAVAERTRDAHPGSVAPAAGPPLAATASQTAR